MEVGKKKNGDERIRTADLYHAKVALSQLSYIPIAITILLYQVLLAVSSLFLGKTHENFNRACPL